MQVQQLQQQQQKPSTNPQNVNIAPNAQHAVTNFSPDTALDATTALLRSDLAPIPTSADHKAVWACVPAGATLTSLEVWSYFHGHNSTVAAKVSSSGKVTGYGPGWLGTSTVSGLKYIHSTAAPALQAGEDPPENPNPTIDYQDARGTANAKFSKVTMGVFYEFPLLSASLAPGHVPVVLAPEVGTNDNTKNFDARMRVRTDSNGATMTDKKTGKVLWGDVQGVWCKESGNVASYDGMVDDCLKKLHALKKPGSNDNYLATALGVADIKRFYLTGHSGDRRV